MHAINLDLNKYLSDLHPMKPVGALAFLLFLFTCSALKAQEQKIIGTHALSDTLTRLTAHQYSLDSIKAYVWADSMKSRINVQTAFDSISLRHKIDSLQNLGQISLPYQHKLDSVIQKKDALVSEVNGKREALLKKSQGRLDDWKSRAEAKLGFMTDQTGAIPDVPGMDVPGLPDTNVPSLDNLSQQLSVNGIELPDMPSLSVLELKNLDLSPDLSSVNKSLSLPEFDGLKGVQEKLALGKEGLGSLSSAIQNPDAAVDASLGKVSELGAVKEQLGPADGIGDNEFMETAEKLKDPEALQNELKEQVVKRAVNHFEGKEQVLQQAMEKMQKYKQKYESLNSLSEIKKRPPNPMKKKPFVERLVPGVAFQILRKEDLFLDINPYIGYRLTGRLTSGIGWNQRLGYSTKRDHFTSASVVYGPRTFTDFKVWRGFSARVEFEMMNTHVPPLFSRAHPDSYPREWVFTTMIGIKKEYRFIKSTKGTAFMMFNLFDHKHRSPYGDVVNSRFGFEWTMKKGKKS
jgi:hypothetical protein